MKVLRRLAAWILGSVLFIAGILKLMDPVGTGLIVTEYFKFFGLGFMMFSSKVVGICLALFETILGAAVITGVWRKVIAMVSLCLLGFFTIVTAILWIANPEMDCGCFGEAIHLTHAQSFIKNIVLLGFWALAFLPFRDLLPATAVKKVSFCIAAASVLFFMVWSLRSIPMMDFTPFAPGTELMGDDDAFDADAPVLSFCNAEYEYADSLATHGKVLVISAYDPDRLSHRDLSRIEACMSDAEFNTDFTVLLLSAGGIHSADSYQADRKTLLTLNRSNGGATYISDGQIIRKWSVNSLPDSQRLSELAGVETTEAVITENGPQRIKLQAFLLYVFAVMLLL